MNPSVQDVLHLTTELLDLLEVQGPPKAVDAAWARVGAIKQLLRPALVALAEDPAAQQVYQLTSQLNNLRVIVRGAVDADLAGDRERLSYEMCALHNAIRSSVEPPVSADNEPHASEFLAAIAAAEDAADERREQALEQERRLRRYDRE